MTLKDIDYYRNRINTAIKEYISLNGVNPSDLTHIEFNGLLRYIYSYVPFKSIKPNKSGWHSVFNKEDISVIDAYIDMLLDICIVYNKVVCFRYVQSLYGIPQQYITSKSKEYDNEIAIHIYQAVKGDRQSSLADRCLDKNSVMALALGKIEYGWNENNHTDININMVGTFDSPFKLLDKYKLE